MIRHRPSPTPVGPSLVDGPPSPRRHPSSAPKRSLGRLSSLARVALLLAGSLVLISSASAQVSTRISSNAPIVNFRLPTFTAEGHREWLVRGSEARMPSLKEIDVRELTLTVFAGDEAGTIQTMILAPVAKVLPEKRAVSGPDTLRVINDQLEATGADWQVTQPAPKHVVITMRQNVRVTFRAELKNLLK